MEKLPEAVLKHILCLVGNALDFLHCERTCKAFRDALEDDDLWGTCEECQPEYQNQQDNWPTKNRERAFVVRALVQCHNWQRGVDSVFRSVLSAREWKQIVSQIFSTLLIDDLIRLGYMRCCSMLSLRGDTSAVLMTIVQESLVLQLQRANSIAAYSEYRVAPYCEEGIMQHGEGIRQYPCLRMDDFFQQDDLTSFQNLLPHHQCQTEQGFLASISDMLNVDHVKRHIIVRRLAYLAGVTKMDDNLFELAWASMIFLIAELLRPACEQLGCCDAVRGEQQVSYVQQKTLYHMGTMRDTSPHAHLLETRCRRCGHRNILHTIVPRQVEEAAKRLGIPHTVLGAEWHVDTEVLNLDYDKAVKLMKQEVAEARSKYRFKGSDDESYASGESHSGNDKSNNDVSRVPDESSKEESLDGGVFRVPEGELAGFAASAVYAAALAVEECTSIESDCGSNDETYVQEDVSEDEDFEMTDDEEADDDSTRNTVVLVKFNSECYAYAYARDLFTPV
jgi:hypothetical protein